MDKVGGPLKGKTPAETQIYHFGPKKRVFVPFACEDG